MITTTATTATAEAVETIWARGLDNEQLAARLLANARDYRWSPIPQRVALLTEAAARLFEGTPALRKAPLPAKAASEPSAGRATATPRKRKSRTDRANELQAVDGAAAKAGQ